MKAILYRELFSIFLYLFSTNAICNIASLEIWTRGSTLKNGDSKKINTQKIDLASIDTKPMDIYDVQYESKTSYQAILMNDLINKQPTRWDGDLVLLHFSNGMIIPAPLAWLNSKSGNIALAIKIQAKDKTWTSRFPSVLKKELMIKNRLPIKFVANKIVSSNMGHPFAGTAKDTFTPWLYADSLVGIEFVDEFKYFAQFNPLPAQKMVGFEVFKSRCSYCHGTKGVGASYGWDVVEPLPLYKKRQPTDLFYHVKVPKAANLQYGSQMPNQPDFKKEEAEAIWQWMKAIAEKGPNPYL